MTEETTNEHVVRRIFDEVVNEGRRDSAIELISEEYLEHKHGETLDGFGYEGWLESVARIQTGFPDFKMDIERLLCRGDSVSVFWTCCGTHTGEFGGIAPTHRRVTWEGLEILRLENGLLVEGWVVVDRLGLSQQLGR